MRLGFLRRLLTRAGLLAHDSKLLVLEPKLERTVLGAVFAGLSFQYRKPRAVVLTLLV